MAAVPELGRATHVEPAVAFEAVETQRLYEQYSGQLFGFCLHQLGNREEAEDAVQTTFLNAFRGLKRGITPEAESAWLFKIAHNVCLTRRRSSYRRGRVESPSDIQALQDFVAAPQRMGTDELIELQEALAAMPSNQRKAILLREWRGLSYQEIADEMELSQSAVETLIFRARRSLANGLEQPPQETKKLWARLRHALDAGSLVAAAKGLFVGGAAVKAVATAAVVTTAGVVATVPSDERGHPARAAERPAAVVVPTPKPAVVEAPLVGRAAAVAAPSERALPRAAAPRPVQPAAAPRPKRPAETAPAASPEPAPVAAPEPAPDPAPEPAPDPAPVSAPVVVEQQQPAAAPPPAVERRAQPARARASAASPSRSRRAPEEPAAVAPRPGPDAPKQAPGHAKPQESLTGGPPPAAGPPAAAPGQARKDDRSDPGPAAVPPGQAKKEGATESAPPPVAVHAAAPPVSVAAADPAPGRSEERGNAGEEHGAKPAETGKGDGRGKP